MKRQIDHPDESTSASVVTKIERYARCPHCAQNSGHSIPIETEEAFGPCYCQHCGGEFDGYVNRNGAVEIWAGVRRLQPTFILLRLDPQPQPVFLVIRSSRLIDSAGADDQLLDEEDYVRSDEFLYTYQSEPGYYLHRSIAVIANGAINPHDIFHYVTTRTTLDGENCNKQLAALFADLTQHS